MFAKHQLYILTAWGLKAWKMLQKLAVPSYDNKTCQFYYKTSAVFLKWAEIKILTWTKNKRSMQQSLVCTGKWNNQQFRALVRRSWAHLTCIASWTDFIQNVLPPSKRLPLNLGASLPPPPRLQHTDQPPWLIAIFWLLAAAN